MSWRVTIRTHAWCATFAGSLALSATAAMLGAPAFGQAIVWQVPAYAGSSNTTGVGMAFIAPATLFVAGNRAFTSPIDQGPHSVRWVTRFDLAGQPLDPQPGTVPQTADDDVASAIAADASGVYVMGNVGTGCVPNAGCLSTTGALARYLVNGVVAWNIAAPSGTAFQALAANAAGTFVSEINVFNAGVRHRDTGGTHVWYEGFDLTGVTGWQLPSVAPLPGAQAVAAGSARDSSSIRPTARPLFGVFGRGLPPAAAGLGGGGLTQVTTDVVGNIYIAGYSQTGSVQFPSIGKILASGASGWGALEPDLSGTGDLAADASGNLIASGVGKTLKYSSDGVVLWRDEAGIVAKSVSVALASTGHIYVAGTIGHPIETVFVRKLGPTGNLIWSTTLPGNNVSQLILASDAPIVMTDVPGAGARLFRLAAGLPGPRRPPSPSSRLRRRPPRAIP